jgi:hypothetical protein
MLLRASETLRDMMGPAPDSTSRPTRDMFASTAIASAAKYETLRPEVGDGLRLPHVIIGSGPSIEDLFVSVATYYPNQLPFTAFAHVFGSEFADVMRDSFSHAHVAVTLTRERRCLALLGAAVGETYLAGLTSSDASLFPSYSACRRSLGYALARASAIYPQHKTEWVMQRWSRLRELSRLSASGPSSAAVETMHRLLFDVGSVHSGSRESNEVFRAAADYLKGPTSHEQLVFAVLGLYPELGPFITALGGPFDSRMKAFTDAVNVVHLGSQGLRTDEIVLGFLSNMILPGSFAHAKVLAKLTEVFPAALVWYGAFCTASSNFDIVQFNAGLVTKLVRDVGREFSFAARPICDIALDELEVLSRLPIKPETLKPIHQRTALVALLPGVEIFARLGLDDEHASDAERDKEAMRDEEITGRLTMLLEDALTLVRRRSVNRPTSGSSRRPRKER